MQDTRAALIEDERRRELIQRIDELATGLSDLELRFLRDCITAKLAKSS